MLNFCKNYNKILNVYDRQWNKIFTEEPSRKNATEINIFAGIIYLIANTIAILTLYPLWYLCKFTIPSICRWINKYTTSKCNKSP